MTIGLLALAAACQSDGRSSGYHAPNIAYGGGDLALVWLDNQPGNEEVKFVLADPETAKARSAARTISKSARGSDPPLLAWDGERWRVMWTNERGIWTITIDQRGRVRGEQKIASGTARLCPQLVPVGDAVVLGWRDEKVLHLAKVGGSEHAVTVEPVSELDAPVLGACALAAKGTDIAVAWADDRETADASLHMSIITTDGRVTADRVLATTPRAASATIAVATEQAGWAVAYASADARGFEIVHVDASLADRSRVRSPGGTGFVRGFGLASATRSLPIWTDVPAPSDKVGAAWFSAPRIDGTIVPQPIGKHGHVRKVANATAVGNTFALTWADNQGGGTINWAVLRRTDVAVADDIEVETLSAAF